MRLVEWNASVTTTTNTTTTTTTNENNPASALPPASASSSAPQYFSVTTPDAAPPGGPWHDTTPTRLGDGALLYANLIEHLDWWDAFFAEGMQVDLAYDRSEGTRVVDMSRAVIAGSMSNYVGLRPNYGDGSNYWSVRAMLSQSMVQF